MTDPFETEVAKVLASLTWPDGNGWTVRINWREAETLAPRVAAAILAYHDHRWGQAMMDASDALAHREAAALAALRGK